MKTDFLRAIACAALVAAAGLLTGTASAQDIELASHADMNNVYARLAELESRLAATNVATGGGCGGEYDACGDECCDRSGIIGGAEVLFLKAYESEGDLNEFDYDEGYRFWIGWQASGGLGVRLRYFDYQETVEETGDLFDVSAVDLEVYDAVQLGCNWDLNIGGGIRYLDMHVDETGTGTAFDEITGVGPVLSAELVRHISDRAAVYAIARESIIVGDGFDGGLAEPDLTVSVSEIQLGVQGQRDWRGGLVFARLGWEAQFYHEIMDGENAAALMGAVFGAGIMR